MRFLCAAIAALMVVVSGPSVSEAKERLRDPIAFLSEQRARLTRSCL